MLIRNATKLFGVMAFLCCCVLAQTTTGSVLATVVDPGDAAVPGVQVDLKNLTTGATRSTTTGPEGIFRFNSLDPAKYTLTMKAGGFKSYTQADIDVTANEIRDLGRIQLTLGSLTEEVSVTALATPVQTASSENSKLFDSNQMLDLTLKSRDLVAALATVPGVYVGDLYLTGGDTADKTYGLQRLQINGGGTSRVNVQVDGITNLDTGSNGGMDFEPNMDAIAEVRVLATNYQAEYGRNPSQISIVTKSGGQQFHGSAWANKRHEMFNAKSFFQNYNGQPKSLYRFFVWGYAVGGPIYVPKTFNRDKKKLFFYVSQEYTRQKPSTTFQYFNMPTAAQRAGNFSGYADQNGKAIALRDPTTGNALPNNNVTALASLFDSASEKYGQAMLNFFPLPNLCGRTGVATSGCTTDADSSQIYKRNYMDSFGLSHPRRNDTARIDYNVTSRLTSWARYVNDYDFNYTGGSYTYELKNAQGQWVPYSLDHPNPGHGWGVGITYTISPSMVNEFTFGKSYTGWDWYAHDPSQLDRANMNNPPSWNNFTNDPNFVNDQKLTRPGLPPGNQNYQVGVPAVSFGGGQEPNEVSMSASNCSDGQCPYTNWNDIYSFNDTISKVWGKHNFKAGFYYERTGKVQHAGSGQYLGNYSFSGSDSAMAAQTQDGFANAFLGNFSSYSEGQRIMGDFWFTGEEFFLQDNWRISRRVTLDLGARFYHLWPQENLNNTSAEWVRSTYNPAQAMRLYYPYCTVAVTTGTCPTANQKSYDPTTGYLTYYALNGTFVPASVGGYSAIPTPFPGMQVATPNNPNLPYSLFTPPQLSPAFRFGVAWDVFGNGKTAVRAGVGQFLNRGDGNQIMGIAGQPPVAVNRSIYYSTVNSIPGYVNNAAISPIAPGEIVGKQPYESAYNGSVMVQENVGFGTVLETAYVFNLRRHIYASSQLNPVPLYSEYNPAYYNPINGGLYANASGKALNDNYFRPLAGLGALTANNFDLSQDYNALQISVRRNMTKHLSYGAAYAWSKIMTGSHSPYFSDKFRNWGPSFLPTPQTLTLNYVYELPNLGQRLNLAPLGWITDHWTWSGITQLRSVAWAATPGISFTGTSSTNPSPNFTGGAEGARMFIIGSPALPSGQVSFVGGGTSNIGLNGTPGNQILNMSAFMIPYPCSWTPASTPQYGVGQSMECFGNAGAGSIISIPNTRVNNWDMTFGKEFPLKSERRVILFRAEMYNIFNHTQFSSWNIGPQYDLGNWQKGVLVQTNSSLGRYTATMNPRQMSMSLRFQF